MVTVEPGRSGRAFLSCGIGPRNGFADAGRIFSADAAGPVFESYNIRYLENFPDTQRSWACGLRRAPIWPWCISRDLGRLLALLGSLDDQHLLRHQLVRRYDQQNLSGPTRQKGGVCPLQLSGHPCLPEAGWKPWDCQFVDSGAIAPYNFCVRPVAPSTPQHTVNYAQRKCGRRPLPAHAQTCGRVRADSLAKMNIIPKIEALQIAKLIWHLLIIVHAQWSRGGLPVPAAPRVVYASTNTQLHYVCMSGHLYHMISISHVHLHPSSFHLTLRVRHSSIHFIPNLSVAEHFLYNDVT